MGTLADILLDQGVVDAAALARAETNAADTGGNLAQSLVALGLATEAQLVRAFASSLGLPYAEVSGAAVDPNAVALLDPVLAQELTVLPVRFGDDDDVVVAFADPAAYDELGQRLEAAIGLPVTLALAPRRALQEAIDIQAAIAPPAAPDDGGDPGGEPEPAAAQPPGPIRPERFRPGSTPAEQMRVMAEEEPDLDLDELLKELVARGGSDLHLTTGIPPAIRIDGDLVYLDHYPKQTPEDTRKTLYAIMTQKQREAFENELELDLSYSIRDVARFRVNIFQQRNSMGAVMRVIPYEILALEELGIPERVSQFAYLPRGFVLVTGPTGSGKSTTLASLIDLANRNRSAHIMTVEDPIEFLHRHKRCVVNQREVGTDTRGFAAALKHVLRQDPDIILVGEMRDLETIQIALTAAETGHLVFGTLHTQDAPQSIDRMIDVFPPHQQEQIRVMLSGALKGVVCQTLIKTADGKGRTAACEVMVATSGIKNLIREGKTHQIYSAIQAGAQDGMIAMDQSLARLVREGRITYDAALERCNDVHEFNRLARRA